MGLALWWLEQPCSDFDAPLALGREKDTCDGIVIAIVALGCYSRLLVFLSVCPGSCDLARHTSAQLQYKSLQWICCGGSQSSRSSDGKKALSDAALPGAQAPVAPPAGRPPAVALPSSSDPIPVGPGATACAGLLP